MTNLGYTIRYFRVVSPIPALMTGTMLVATLVGLLAIMRGDPQDGTAAVPLLVLQAFSASTGFSSPARRGYFDVLLARGDPRSRIAGVQWLTAIAPGLAGWMVLAAADATTHGTAHSHMLASGTLIALLLVSTIPWAVTVSLPRFSGAIGWLLVVSMGAVGGGWWAPIRGVVFPISIVGEPLRDRPEVVIAAVALSLSSMAIALWWAHRTDIPLEAAQ